MSSSQRDGGPEWTNIVRALQALGRWKDGKQVSDEDMKAALAEIEKLERGEPNAIDEMKRRFRGG